MGFQPPAGKNGGNTPHPIACCVALILFLCVILFKIAIMQDNIHSRLFDQHEPGNIAWLCYYGSDRDILALPSYELLILEADALGPITKKDKDNRVCVAYMSIGEISKSRWFWQLVQGRPWLLDENPDWPGALKVDPRSQEWSDLLINTIAPGILEAGYDGFMLDNVDIGEYLENTSPEAYAGAKEAVENIIRRLRQVYPKAVIIANGGLETAANTADCLDAVVCESTFSRWIARDDGSFVYAEVSSQDRLWLRPRLLRIRGAGIPILALEYVDPEDAIARQHVRETVKKAGYHPYIGERNLMLVPSEGSRTGDLPPAK